VATKTKKSSAKKSDESVVRIRANASTVAVKSKPAEAAETVVTAPIKANKAVKKADKKPAKVKTARKLPKVRVLKAIGSYFKGAWVELRQVRWPNRRATWSLTGAVIAFSAFFVVFVLLLDAGFKYLFELILKK